jgi:hypothetical protein
MIDMPTKLQKKAGFSLQAGVAAQAWERDNLERLCRHISRPSVSEKRLSLTLAGNIRYQQKIAYHESSPHERSECFGYGTTHAAVLTHPCSTLHSYVHALHILTTGFHCKTGIIGAKTESQPHPVSRCFCWNAAPSKQ